jgi:hypothetical protein
MTRGTADVALRLPGAVDGDNSRPPQGACPRHTSSDAPAPDGEPVLVTGRQPPRQPGPVSLCDTGRDESAFAEG